VETGGIRQNSVANDLHPAWKILRAKRSEFPTVSTASTAATKKMEKEECNDATSKKMSDHRNKA
jgi:hypothetical protein